MLETQERHDLELSAPTDGGTQVGAQLTSTQIEAVDGEEPGANVTTQTINGDTRDVTHQKAPVRWCHRHQGRLRSRYRHA